MLWVLWVGFDSTDVRGFPEKCVTGRKMLIGLSDTSLLATAKISNCFFKS